MRKKAFAIALCLAAALLFLNVVRNDEDPQVFAQELRSVLTSGTGGNDVTLEGCTLIIVTKFENGCACLQMRKSELIRLIWRKSERSNCAQSRIPILCASCLISQGPLVRKPI